MAAVLLASVEASIGNADNLTFALVDRIVQTNRLVHLHDASCDIVEETPGMVLVDRLHLIDLSNVAKLAPGDRDPGRAVGELNLIGRKARLGCDGLANNPRGLVSNVVVEGNLHLSQVVVTCLGLLLEDGLNNKSWVVHLGIDHKARVSTSSRRLLGLNPHR